MLFTSNDGCMGRGGIYEAVKYMCDPVAIHTLTWCCISAYVCYSKLFLRIRIILHNVNYFNPNTEIDNREQAIGHRERLRNKIKNTKQIYLI